MPKSKLSGISISPALMVRSMLKSLSRSSVVSMVAAMPARLGMAVLTASRLPGTVSVVIVVTCCSRGWVSNRVVAMLRVAPVTVVSVSPVWASVALTFSRLAVVVPTVWSRRSTVELRPAPTASMAWPAK